MYTRRELMTRALATAGLCATPARVLATAPALPGNPFTLGVASGFPEPDCVVLWTRLAPSPLEPGGGMPDAVYPVAWQVAGDDGMRNVVRQGTAYAAPDWAHAVHVEVDGLEPERPYWYRFVVAGGAESPIGRTRTAPAFDSANRRLRLAVCSCQMYEHGYYNAYTHMLDDELDAILHVGDYIYEGSWGERRVRRHEIPEVYTLDDYRARYATYRLDPDLQAAHAAYPWIATWDDHEVENDYAAAISQRNDVPELFLARRAAAYRAYYEHMPLPRRCVPAGPHMRLYGEQAFGRLLSLYVLDGRQYRTPHACPPPGRRGGARVAGCAALSDPARTMLGEAQEQWLYARLGMRGANWHVLAQQTVMTYVDEDPGPGTRFWTDGWNGYPAARGRLLDVLHGRSVANPVILSGDIHAFIAADLNRVPGDPKSPVVASELVTTSISSQGVSTEVTEVMQAANANVKFADPKERGYTLLDVSPERMTADLVAMETVFERGCKRRVLKSFVIEAGKPGVTPG